MVYLQRWAQVGKWFTRIQPLLRNAYVSWVRCRESLMRPWFVAAGAHAAAWRQNWYQRGSVGWKPTAGRARRVDWVLCLIGRVSWCAAFKAASILFWRDAEAEPRTPVLTTRWIGSGPECSVPSRYIPGTRLRSDGRAKRRLLSACRGACAVGRGTLGAMCARCGRGTLFTISYI